jgi:long-chain acyl-CoA synthetase
VNLAALYQPVMEAVADRAALVIGVDRVTYRELDEGAGVMAARLAHAGVGRGDRVPLVDECSVLFVTTVLGAARLGAAAAPMNHRLTASEVAELCQTCGCGPVGVAGTAWGGPLAEALGATPLGEEVLADAGVAPPPMADVDDADTALVLFTSGTTGLPKAVPLSHGELVPRVQLFSAGFDPSRSATVSLLCIPVVHVGGLVGLLVSLASGTTTIVQRRFDAGEWLRLVEEHRVQRTFVVPTMLARILDHPDLGRRDMSSLQTLAYGAAPMPVDVIRRAVDALPHVAFTNVFGQTETVGAVTMLSPDDHRHPERVASVGRLLPGFEMRVVDPATDADVPTGEPGEFWVREGGGDWRRTGDVVRCDADGYLYPAGRLSDTINRGGEKIGPAEVESVLREHPAVADVAVAGVPDDDLGQRVGAAVVLSKPVDLDALKGWCRERLAPFKVPERIAVVDEIPLTDVGKVSRRVIAELITGA